MAEAEGARPGRDARDLENLRGAAHERAMLSEARVVLARLLGIPPGEALQYLIWLARSLDMSLVEAASLLVKEGASGEVRAVLTERRAPPTEGGAAERQAAASQAEDILHQVAAEDTTGDSEILARVPEDPMAQAVLDATLDSSAHLVPVRRENGEMADFLFADLNDIARDMFGRGREDLKGQRLLQTDPGALQSGLFGEYVRVLETGTSFERSSIPYTTAQRGLSRSSRTSVRCVKVPTGVCLTWRYHYAEDRTMRRLERVERLAAIGFGEWDLVTGEAEWTPQMRANYGLGPDEVPPSPYDLLEVVAEEDVPLVEEAVQRMFSRREPVKVEHQVIGADGKPRHLWMFVEPVLDENGLPILINIVSQDISRRRGVERALSETRQQMVRQQERMAQERQVAVTLRRAILPDEDGIERLPGLATAIRSLPAESTARIGGDWYATRVLANGNVLFAIGDAAGHGLPATATMARSRNGLLGLASTGESPGRLVGWLNELVGTIDPPATGTAIVAQYYPRHRLLEWTCAGHLPPILVRDGNAETMEVVLDPMLGAVPEWEYSTVTTPLERGDVVFLYTDGLVERRDADIEERIVRLALILRDCSSRPDLMVDEVLGRMERDREADDTTLFVVRVE